MNFPETRGRFLPSRVYSRWKWTVRLGLLLVPLGIFLSGGLVLFLTPNQYRSATLFRMENAPPPREVVELIESRGLLERVVEQLELTKRLDVDKDTAIEKILSASTVKLVPETRMIEFSVTMTDKVDARDIAETIPNALKTLLVDASNLVSNEKAAQFGELIKDATDAAEDKAAHLANLENPHFPALRSSPTALSGASRQKQFPAAIHLDDEHILILESTCPARRPTRHQESSLFLCSRLWTGAGTILTGNIEIDEF